jgi:hypothetical protein
MINKIELFFFILSFAFSLPFVFQFITIIKEENPVPMKISKGDKIVLYFAISYIITYIINLFL